MDAATLQRLLDNPVHRWPRRDWALLDIREAGEAHGGHIPTATSLPRRMLEYRIRSMIPNPATRIIVYDAGSLAGDRPDRRAALAAATLSDLGYSGTEILDGGISAWRAISGVIATGANVPSKHFGEKILAEDSVPAITARELANAIANEDRIAIRDVRTVEEFADHHLPGAVSSPGFDLFVSLGQLSVEHDLVIINCAGRTRSIIATATARRLGIDNVRALENGTMGWRLAGEQVHSGDSRPDQKVPVAAVNEALLAKARALSQSTGLTTIDPDHLAAALHDPSRLPVIIDLRPLSEFSDGHLPQAIALPGGQAIQRTDEFLAIPGRPVVLYAASELQAHLAGYWLKRMGFPDVRVLAGGFERWRAERRPVATGRHEPPFIPDEASLWQKVSLADPADVADTPGVTGGDPQRVVLDVRTSRDYRTGHPAGSIWAPRGWLEDEVHGFTRTMNMIVFGRNDIEALLAASQLIAEGFQHVTVLKGGMAGWRTAGLPVETGLGDNAERYLPDLVEVPYSGDLARMRAYLDWEVALHAAGSERDDNAPPAPD